MGNLCQGWHFCKCREKSKKKQPITVIPPEEGPQKQSDESLYGKEEPPADQIQINQHTDYLDQMLSEQKMRGHTQSFAMRFNQDSYFKPHQILYYKNHYNVRPRKITPKPFKYEKYHISWHKDRVIGCGSFGTVCLGFNRDNGQIMAVKQTPILNPADIDRVKTLEQEVWILSQLRNQHIVQYYGATRDSQYLNIFLEYCSGGSISSLLKQYGKFNEKLIQKYTRDILQGLEYLHALGVIHRDIKGANVLLSKNGKCKIADFGNAKVIYRQAQGQMPQSMQGTPNWMAPEVIRRGQYGRSADIWSVGCLVIEMATAKPPWYQKNQEHNPVSRTQAEAKSSPPIPEHLSTNAQNFLKDCLNVNPSQRANVYQLLHHPFISDLPKKKSSRFSRLNTSNKSQVYTPPDIPMGRSQSRFYDSQIMTQSIPEVKGEVLVQSANILHMSGQISDSETEEQEESLNNVPPLERNRGSTIDPQVFSLNFQTGFEIKVNKPGQQSQVHKIDNPNPNEADSRRGYHRGSKPDSVTSSSKKNHSENSNFVEIREDEQVDLNFPNQAPRVGGKLQEVLEELQRSQNLKKLKKAKELVKRNSESKGEMSKISSESARSAIVEIPE